MRDKKAVSAVVATVLIILITIAAVTIIWQGIKLLVENRIEGATSCTEATAEFSVITAQGYTCLDGSDANVQVSRGAKELDLVQLNIIVAGGGDTLDTEEVSGTDLLDTNEEKTYTISGVGTTADSVRIAPVIKIGETQKTCDPTQSYPIVACD